MAETLTGFILIMNFGFPRFIKNQYNQIWDPKYWKSLDQKATLNINLGSIGSRVAEQLIIRYATNVHPKLTQTM